MPIQNFFQVIDSRLKFDREWFRMDESGATVRELIDRLQWILYNIKGPHDEGSVDEKRAARHAYLVQAHNLKSCKIFHILVRDMLTHTNPR